MNGHDVIRNIIFSGIVGCVMTLTVSKHYSTKINWFAGISISIIVAFILTFLDYVIP